MPTGSDLRQPASLSQRGGYFCAVAQIHPRLPELSDCVRRGPLRIPTQLLLERLSANVFVGFASNLVYVPLSHALVGDPGPFCETSWHGQGGPAARFLHQQSLQEARY